MAAADRSGEGERIPAVGDRHIPLEMEEAWQAALEGERKGVEVDDAHVAVVGGVGVNVGVGEDGDGDVGVGVALVAFADCDGSRRRCQWGFPAHRQNLVDHQQRQQGLFLEQRRPH